MIKPLQVELDELIDEYVPPLIDLDQLQRLVDRDEAPGCSTANAPLTPSARTSNRGSVTGLVVGAERHDGVVAAESERVADREKRSIAERAR